MSSADTSAGFNYVWFKSYERMTTKESTPVNDIMLYLPEKAVIPSTVKWDMTGIGMGGKQAENAARSGKDMTAGKTWEAVQNIGASALAGGAKQVVDTTFATASNMFNSEHVYGLMAGGIPNPYMTMLFKGVDPRAFEFSFKFYPHNAAEAFIIWNIIRTFREDSLPPGSQSANPVHLGYPREYEIDYTGSVGWMYLLHKYKRSVITRIDTDFTGAGMWSSTSPITFPTYIALSLTFTELEIVLRDDVTAGY